MDPNKEQPWWNDGDKMGGLAATVIFLLVIIILGAGAVKLAMMILAF